MLQIHFVFLIYVISFACFLAKRIRRAKKNLRLWLFGRVAHPGCHGLSHSLLEGKAEGAVAPIAAVAGQVLGCDGLPRFSRLAIETHKVLDTQTIDIGIIRDALLGKIGTQIGAVGTDGRGKLLQREVVL